MWDTVFCPSMFTVCAITSPMYRNTTLRSYLTLDCLTLPRRPLNMYVCQRACRMFGIQMAYFTEGTFTVYTVDVEVSCIMEE